MQSTDQILETKQLLATRLVPAHLPEVTTVLDENFDVLQLLWKEIDIDWEAQRMVTHTDVPPEGLSENNRNYLLKTYDGALVGVLCSCLYFPSVRSSYIGSLFLCPAFRRKGMGKEIVEAWYSVLHGEGITETKVYVGLKNWPALRFWVSIGFNRLSKISGDEEFADDKFAGIELCRSLEAAIV